MTAAAPADLDRERLSQALALAEEAVGVSEPNPRVGCVIGRPTGQVLASGHTQAVGRHHAEAAALAQAREHGVDVRGATAWVTLEPCAHQGRTPPCADALVAAGVARVVVGAVDPFAQVDGRGIARLRAAGIQVDEAAALGLPDLAEACREMNIGFFSRCERGRPWVRMKAAASLDGRTALSDGTSQWITSGQARQDGHRWRKRAGAILTGIGTVLEDDPRLDVRGVPTQVQPVRVIVDSHLMTPLHARVLHAPGTVWLAHAAEEPARAQALAERGVQLLHLPGPGGKVDLTALMHALAERHINELHVEAGHKLNASLLKAGLVDEWLLYLAPKLLGEGREIAALGRLASLEEAQLWRFTEVAQVGPDLRVMLRPGPRAADGSRRSPP